jgi:hypothetical protein
MKHIKFFENYKSNEGIGKYVSGALLGDSLLTSPKVNAQINDDPTVHTSYSPFTKDKELRSAILRNDLSKFCVGDINLIIGEKEKIVSIDKLNQLIEKYLPKNTILKKSVETNNGYTIVFGAYKGEDVLVYFTFNLNLDGKIVEVTIDENE